MVDVYARPNVFMWWLQDNLRSLFSPSSLNMGLGDQTQVMSAWQVFTY